MKIAVCIKQVPDNSRLSFKDGKPVLDGVPMILNPFDEYALETAIRLKEQAGEESTVTVLSLGPASTREILKKALASGGDEAILLSDSQFDESFHPTTRSHILAHAITHLLPNADLVIFGQSALDDAAAQTGPQVAELLGWPSLNHVYNAKIAEPKALTLHRNGDQGAETYSLQLPGVICMGKCPYELRSANIKGVMRANKAEIPVKTASDLGLSIEWFRSREEKIRMLDIRPVPPKSAGVRIREADPKAAVSQLIEQLKQRKVL